MKAETNRIQVDFLQFALAIEHRFGDDAFPDFLIRGKAPRIVSRTGIEVIRCVRAERQVELIVALLRLEGQGFILENEIGDAVKNRLAFVYLDGAQDVRSMAHEEVGAGVDS